MKLLILRHFRGESEADTVTDMYAIRGVLEIQYTIINAINQIH